MKPLFKAILIHLFSLIEYFNTYHNPCFSPFQKHFSHCTKALPCVPMAHFSTVHAFFLRTGLHLTYLTFWVYTTSLCVAGADSMRTQQR